MSIHSWPGRFAAVAALALAWGAGGCGDCRGPNARLRITAPSSGITLTAADDALPATPTEVDFTVTVDARRLAVGETITLFGSVDDVTMGAPIASAPLPDSGTVDFSVALPDGDYTLVACALADCDIQSDAVPVTVQLTTVNVTFVQPIPPTGGRVDLGGVDDTDGTPCGLEFATTVQVTTDAAGGSTARVYVNGTPRAQVLVTGGAALFEDVVLDNRGDTLSNTIAVEIETSDGTRTVADFPGEIFVDCAGPSCALTQPDVARAYLNASIDTSAAPGLQTPFVTTTSADAIGEPVRLIIDGDDLGAPAVNAAAVGAGGEATFAGITLAEGPHMIRAECEDSLGNRTASGTASWTVDLSPCGIVIVAPAPNQLYIDTAAESDDVNTTDPGLQVAATGTVTGSDCATVTVGSCGAVLAPVTLTGTSFSGEITLSSAAAQDVCAEVEDAAGNIGSGQVSVRVQTEAPQVELVVPATTAYNLANDAVPTSPTCESAFEVRCTDVGQNVEIWREGTTSALVGGTAPCVANGTVPSPFLGLATFAQVSLPTVNAGTPYNLVARQMGERLLGVSTPLTITADCSAPSLTVTSLVRGTQTLTFCASTGSGTALPGSDWVVNVQNANSPFFSVDLTLTDPMNPTVPVYSATSVVRIGLTNQFLNVPFTVGGDLVLRACSTDGAGNQGCAADCTISVVDLPLVQVTQPAANAVLTTGNDCNGASPGLQVQVRANTDVNPASGSATVTVGASGTPQNVPAGDFVVIGPSLWRIQTCVDTTDGVGIPITVAATDARGTASTSVSVTIDTQAPTTPVSNLEVESVVDRRGGAVRFRWDRVTDTGGAPLASYEMRCDPTAITTEPAWTAATARPVTGVGQDMTMPTKDVGVVDAFRILDAPVHCTLRGVDSGGLLTPIGSSASVTLSFLTHVIDPAAGVMNMGRRIAPVGDVNGDGGPDFLVAGSNVVDLYLGPATAGGSLPGAPSVRFTGPALFGLAGGDTIAGIGNFGGDAHNDLVIGSPGENGSKGAVYVFFGRSTWPASFDLTANACGGGSCDADICICGDDGVPASGPDEGAGLGLSVGSVGDFDDDGRSDLAIGAPGAGASPGNVYILRGGTVGAGTIALPGMIGSAPNGFVVTGASSELFGNDVIGVGDRNGDDHGDLVVLAPRASSTNRFYQRNGTAYPMGSSGLVALAATEFHSEATSVVVGSLGSSVGDVNGDGHRDVAIFSSRSGGQIDVFLGVGGSYVQDGFLRFNNDEPVSDRANDAFGRTIGVGFHPVLGRLDDVDDDGLADIVAGALELGTNTVPSAQLFYSDPLPASIVIPSSLPVTSFRNRSSADVTLDPGMSTGSTGRDAAYVGDVDRDGYPDIAVGDVTGSGGVGRVVLFY